MTKPNALASATKGPGLNAVAFKADVADTATLEWLFQVDLALAISNNIERRRRMAIKQVDVQRFNVISSSSSLK